MSRVSLRRARGAGDDTGGGAPDGFEANWSDAEGDFPGADGDDLFSDDADPRELARWTRQMSRQMGEPLKADLDRALSDIERGADPDEALDRLDESAFPEPGE